MRAPDDMRSSGYAYAQARDAQPGSGVFRPAPSRQRKIMGPGTSYPERMVFRPFSTAERVLLFAGLCLLALIVFVPIWMAIEYLTDSIPKYFVDNFCLWALVFSMIVLVVGYFIFVRMLYTLGPSYIKSSQTTIGVGCLFLAAAGIIMLLGATPLQSNADRAYTQLWSNCAYGGKSRQLFDAYQHLYALRMQPTCIDLPSVEECDGYISTIQGQREEAKLLKEMEGSLHCTGFCYQSMIEAQAAQNATQSGSSLLQLGNSHVSSKASRTHKKARQAPHKFRDMLRKLGKQPTGGELARDLDHHPSLAELATKVSYDDQTSLATKVLSAETSTGFALIAQTPPSLFSHGTEANACEYMAARKMRYGVEASANVLFWMGVAVVGTAVFITVLQFGGAFIGTKGRETYGAEFERP